MTTTQSGYVLGSKDDELDQLDLQAGYYRMATVPPCPSEPSTGCSPPSGRPGYRRIGATTSAGCSAVPVSVRRR